MNTKKGNLLIVDDNSLNIDLLVETLKPFNMNVSTYSNPLDALEQTKEQKFDLALFDVVMPNLNGFELAEEFLKTHPNTPLVFVSAHGSDENKIKGYNTGSIAYIEKPFNIKTIRAQIGRILKIKSLQDELFFAKEQLENIFEFSSDEIILANKDFDVISKNHRIFIGGHKEHSNFIQILDKYKQHENIETLTKFVNSESRTTTFKIQIEDTITNVKISKIMNAENILSGYLIVLRDITEDIRRINLKEQFIATLTHDLKTPIRAESRALELLMSGSFGKLTDEQMELVKEIYSSSKFMAKMTDNLLTRYKIDNGEICLRKELNSIKSTVQKCAENIKYLLEAKNQTLKIKNNAPTEFLLYDDLEITRVLNNVITNASEYSPENSSIKIDISEHSSNLIISVTDNGPGIAKDEARKIFIEHETNAKKFKKVGSGLGLFISKKIMQAHNGDITVESTLGKGTTFRIFLPDKNIQASEVFS